MIISTEEIPINSVSRRQTRSSRKIASSNNESTVIENKAPKIERDLSSSFTNISNQITDIKTNGSKNNFKTMTVTIAVTIVSFLIALLVVVYNKYDITQIKNIIENFIQRSWSN